jgi:hypothetical protein
MIAHSRIAGRGDAVYGGNHGVYSKEDEVKRSLRHFWLAVLPLTFAPVAVQGQDATEQLQDWYVELQEIEARLGPIEEQALLDPQLRSEQAQVTNLVQKEMLRRDPLLTQRIERLRAIQEEGRAAIAADDTQRVLALAEEAEAIQRHFTQVQIDVLQHGEVAVQVNAFRERLQSRMIEVNPEAEGLLRRHAELERRILQLAEARH